jgi:hypothetical protein
MPAWGRADMAAAPGRPRSAPFLSRNPLRVNESACWIEGLYSPGIVSPAHRMLLSPRKATTWTPQGFLGPDSSLVAFAKSSRSKRSWSKKSERIIPPNCLSTMSSSTTLDRASRCIRWAIVCVTCSILAVADCNLCVVRLSVRPRSLTVWRIWLHAGPTADTRFRSARSAVNRATVTPARSDGNFILLEFSHTTKVLDLPSLPMNSPPRKADCRGGQMLRRTDHDGRQE